MHSHCIFFLIIFSLLCFVSSTWLSYNDSTSSLDLKLSVLSLKVRVFVDLSSNKLSQGDVVFVHFRTDDDICYVSKKQELQDARFIFKCPCNVLCLLHEDDFKLTSHIKNILSNNTPYSLPTSVINLKKHEIVLTMSKKELRFQPNERMVRLGYLPSNSSFIIEQVLNTRFVHQKKQLYSRQLSNWPNLLLAYPVESRTDAQGRQWIIRVLNNGQPGYIPYDLVSPTSHDLIKLVKKNLLVIETCEYPTRPFILPFMLTSARYSFGTHQPHNRSKLTAHTRGKLFWVVPVLHTLKSESTEKNDPLNCWLEASHAQNLTCLHQGSFNALWGFVPAAYMECTYTPINSDTNNEDVLWKGGLLIPNFLTLSEFHIEPISWSRIPNHSAPRPLLIKKLYIEDQTCSLVDVKVLGCQSFSNYIVQTRPSVAFRMSTAVSSWSNPKFKFMPSLDERIATMLKIYERNSPCVTFLIRLFVGYLEKRSWQPGLCITNALYENGLPPPHPSYAALFHSIIKRPFPVKQRKTIKILSQLGAGAFGKVYLATIKGENKEMTHVAIKLVKAGNKVQHIINEVEALLVAQDELDDCKKDSFLPFPRYFGTFQFIKYKGMSFQNCIQKIVTSADESLTTRGVHYIAMVMEPMQGVQLSTLIGDKKLFSKLDETQRANIIYNLLRAVCCLHRRGILHRDLKPWNIFIEPDEQGNLTKVRVIDFSAACHFGFDDHSQCHMGTTYEYASPALLIASQSKSSSMTSLSSLKCHPKYDLWSVVVMALELATCTLVPNVFKTENCINDEQVIKVLLQSPLHHFYSLTDKKTLEMPLIQVEPALLRNFCASVLLKNHLEEMLDVEECMKHPYFECYSTGFQKDNLNKISTLSN